EDALAAARAFGASASHELRTPLQSALTNLDVASASGHGGAEVDAARDELRRAAERLSAVRALSAVDLVSAAEFVEHDLVELVDRVLAGFTGRFESVDLLGADHVTIRGWPEGISLAIENVVRNASVHANPGESVALVVRVATDATVTIDDDGSGIGADERARLLGRYERGSTSAAGSGLGLTLAARVSAAHGGSLVLDDSPTGGLRAILRFS
ncbi:MAG: HAMP domain-containing sensor histidine kinase, partial [Actinomycetota bacterium]